MSKLFKQLLAVALAFQTSLSGISTIVHDEEPENFDIYVDPSMIGIFPDFF